MHCISGKPRSTELRGWRWEDWVNARCCEVCEQVVRVNDVFVPWVVGLCTPPCTSCDSIHFNSTQFISIQCYSFICNSIWFNLNQNILSYAIQSNSIQCIPIQLLQFKSLPFHSCFYSFQLSTIVINSIDFRQLQ